MDISAHEREAFMGFVELNAALWQIEATVTSGIANDSIVLVDLLSQDQNHIVRALYAAKILQRQWQGKLVGVVGNLLFNQTLSFAYDKDAVIKLARSYGVIEFLDLEVAAGPNSPPDKDDYFKPADIEAKIVSARECPDADLSRLVLDWRTTDGVWIGEFIFETAIRISKNPFLAEIRENFEKVTREAYRIYNVISKLLRTCNVSAYVSCHLNFTQQGMLADFVLRRGGKVIAFDHSGNFSAYLLRKPPAGKETIWGMIRQIDYEFFEREFAKAKRDTVSRQLVEKLRLLSFSGRFVRPFWWQETSLPAPHVVRRLRGGAMEKLGWPDAASPVVCVFMHSFTDGPRCDESLYDDYYVWVKETLKIAMRDTAKKWIFKKHPLSAFYDATNVFDRLKAECQNQKNIAFVDSELDKVEIFAVCDLAVTVRGSIAIEMSMFGTPTLLAGRSAFSELGFCYVANSVNQYCEFLTSKFETLSFSSHMIERANFYLLFEKIICRIESTFIPYWKYEWIGGGNLWNELSERIRCNISNLDPVAIAIGAMQEGKSARTINPRYRDLQEGADLTSLDRSIRGEAGTGHRLGPRWRWLPSRMIERWLS